jgi:hypothetical protein
MTNNEHAPGVYFGLDEAEYHADPAIGSTDIRALARNPSAYWFDSHMNKARRAKAPTDSQILGTALHTLVLCGQEAFDLSYECGPNQTGMSSGQKATSTKAARERAAMNSRISLRKDDYERIVIASAMVTLNPELRGAFQSGHPEVSVFWERDGIRCKARFDYLKIRGIGELKSVSNPFDLDFRQACRNAIDRYHLHEQASWYMEARSVMRGLLNDCRLVHGYTGPPAWINELRDAPQWGWGWVFVQADGAPLTWSKNLSPGNPILKKGHEANMRGLDEYRAYAEKFGTDGGMWLLIERPTELTEDEMSYRFGER